MSVQNAVEASMNSWKSRIVEKGNRSELFSGEHLNLVARQDRCFGQWCQRSGIGMRKIAAKSNNTFIRSLYYDKEWTEWIGSNRVTVEVFLNFQESLSRESDV